MSAQLAGWAGLQNRSLPLALVRIMALAVFCLFLPEMNFSILAAGGGPADRDLGAADDPGPPAGPEVFDDLGEGAEPETGRDGAAPLGEQRPHLADGAGDGGAVDAELAGQHVVSSCVARVDEGGQEPVDENQLVLGASADGPLPRPGLQSRPMSLVP
ncbi:hypothetical protein ACIP10_36285 [Streptomyces galbus]|uniref:hypothetical protein n=1 Tax=Streptomyces galbus TaxID=33898 RepID=UPI0038269373